MKRSRSIRLVLIGGLTAGALNSCGPAEKPKPPVSTSCVYTNNYHLPGIGYYHAPFRAWYTLPYNHYDPATRRYYQGGQWAAEPYQSITNISAPTAQAAAFAESRRTDVQRGGFGSSSRSHSIHS